MEIVHLPLTLKELNHKLRLPLTGILGCAALLNDENLTAKQKQFVNHIITSGNALLTLAEVLLQAKTIKNLNIAPEEN